DDPMNHQPHPPTRPYRAAAVVAGAALVVVLATGGWTALFFQGGKDGPVAKTTVTPHYSWVAPDATFFISFRVAELWASDDGKLLREGIPDLERMLTEGYERELGLPARETEILTVVVPSFDGMFERRSYEKRGYGGGASKA